MALLFFLVSFGTSVAGGICGIGGGGIIKPVLDFWGIASVAAASFLSGCTVLSMSFYNVGGNLAGRSAGIELRTGTPLALGAAAGGLLGSRLFSWLWSFAPSEGAVGAVQSICLLILVLGTLIYTLKKVPSAPIKSGIQRAVPSSGWVWAYFPVFWESEAVRLTWWFCTTFLPWKPSERQRTPCISFCSARS